MVVHVDEGDAAGAGERLDHGLVLAGAHDDGRGRVVEKVLQLRRGVGRAERHRHAAGAPGGEGGGDVRLAGAAEEGDAGAVEVAGRDGGGGGLQRGAQACGGAEEVGVGSGRGSGACAERSGALVSPVIGFLATPHLLVDTRPHSRPRCYSSEQKIERTPLPVEERSMGIQHCGQRWGQAALA